MIDLSDSDIVAERRSGDGRFLIFHKIDRPPEAMLPWFGVILDTGSDGHGLLVSLDPLRQDGCWSAVDLLHFVQARARAEEDRRFAPLVAEVGQNVASALRHEQSRRGSLPSCRLRFRPGPEPSPYPWTVAVLDGHPLPLCPDPESREEGVTPEQVLMLLDQVFSDAVVPRHQRRSVLAAREHVRSALKAERRRVLRVRALS